MKPLGPRHPAPGRHAGTSQHEVRKEGQDVWLVIAGVVALVILVLLGIWLYFRI